MIPQIPTPPEERKPPFGIIEMVGEMTMAASWILSSSGKLCVRANRKMEPIETSA